MRVRLVLAGFFAASVVFVAPAHSAPPLAYDDLHVAVRTKTVHIPRHEARSVTVECPSTGQAFSGGAFFHRPGHGPRAGIARHAHLVQSTPMNSKDPPGSWFAEGFNDDGPRDLRLTVRVACTDQSITSSSGGAGVTLSPSSTFVFSDTCSPSSVIYDGGVSVLKYANGDPDPALDPKTHFAASVAGVALDRWEASFYNGSTTVKVIAEDSRACTKALATFAPPVLRTIDETGKGIGGRANCPAGTRVVTGGAFFHQRNAGIIAGDADRSIISSSIPTGDRRGWYANGFAAENGTDDLQLTIEAVCLTRAVH